MPQMADYFLSIGDALSSLGARVQRLRLSRNVTQQELAEKAGVGLKALRRLERGLAFETCPKGGADDPFNGTLSTCCQSY